MPLIDHVGRRGDVALGGEAEAADHRVELAGVKLLDHLVEIGADGAGHRLGPSLDRGVGVEGIALGLVAAGAEGVHHRLGLGNVAGMPQ